MTDRLITARADQVSGKEFFDALFRRDSNDISNCDQAGGYFYRDGGWWKIKPEHVGVQITEPAQGDPLLPENRRDAA